MDIEFLALHVFSPHVDFAFEIELGTECSCSDPMLAGIVQPQGFGDLIVSDGVVFVGQCNVNPDGTKPEKQAFSEAKKEEKKI